VNNLIFIKDELINKKNIELTTSKLLFGFEVINGTSHPITLVIKRSELGLIETVTIEER
jgi:hypothetical protein